MGSNSWGKMTIWPLARKNVKGLYEYPASKASARILSRPYSLSSVTAKEIERREFDSGLGSFEQEKHLCHLSRSTHLTALQSRQPLIFLLLDD